VITGRSLPDGDVLSFVSALRAAEATATVPVLMISDLGQRAAVVAATEAGVSSYLLRPFMLSALQSRIRALLRPAEGSRGGADVAPAAAEAAAEPEALPEAKAA
jgi:two-component system response regulator RpaA